MFLLVTIAFWKGHSVARYVGSLAPLTPLTRSAALCFATPASLAHSVHGLAHSLCSLPRGTVVIHRTVFMLRSRSKETNAIVAVTRNTPSIAVLWKKKFIFSFLIIWCVLKISTFFFKEIFFKILLPRLPWSWQRRPWLRRHRHREHPWARTSSRNTPCNTTPRRGGSRFAAPAFYCTNSIWSILCGICCCWPWPPRQHKRRCCILGI